MCRKDLTSEQVSDKTYKLAKEVREKLFSLADTEYRQFHSGLCPNVDNIIGVRVPILRNYAKEIAKRDDFLCLFDEENEYYNGYYEELMLRGMLIGFMKGKLDDILDYIRRFVPHINNWAICDVFCAGLKITKKHYDEMWGFLCPYLKSDKEFEVRFGVVMLLDYYVTDDYIDRVIAILDGIHHDGYYVKMAVAWALSVCYIKQREKTLAYIKGENSLDDFTFNKALSKINESFRVTKEDKQMLRAMRRK